MMGSEWRSQLSNSLLVEIFGYLELTELGRAARVCRVWSEVLRHDGLWHNLARRRWKIKGVLPDDQTSWQEEVKRLVHHVPLKQSEVLYHHEDEILDVSVSHDGRYFATTSKDTSAVIWKFGNNVPTSRCGSINTSQHLQWTSTHSSVFNKSDTLLLVAGVKDSQEYSEGRGLILTVPDMVIIMEVPLNPYTLDGTWLTERIVTGGRCNMAHNIAMIQAYEVTNETITKAKKLNLDPPEGRTVIRKQGRNLFSYEASLCHQMNIIVASVPDVSSDVDHQQCRNASSSRRQTRSSVKKMKTDSSGNGLELEGDLICESYCNCPSTSKRKHGSTGCKSNCTQGVACMSKSAQVRSGVSLETGKLTYIAMVTGIHDVIGIQQITQADLDRALVSEDVEGNGDTPKSLLEKFDHELQLNNCYITGMCLSHDHRYLYINHRELDESVEGNLERADFARLFKKKLIIGTFDMTSMTRLVNIEYTGHLAFSSCPVWYICLATSKDFIGSGSEEARAYIWDRHHRVMLGELKHEEGVLNGMAFSPVDQETCVTVCDDKIVKIWKSRNRMAEVVMHQP